MQVMWKCIDGFGSQCLLLAFDFSCTEADLQGTYVHMLILHAAQFSLIVIVYLWLKFFLDSSFAYDLVPICYRKKEIVGIACCPALIDCECVFCGWNSF
jgi:hypothetical protein